MSESFEESIAALQKLMEKYDSYDDYATDMLKNLDRVAKDGKHAKVPDEVKNVCSVIASRSLQCQSIAEIAEFAPMMISIIGQIYRAGFAAGST